MFRSEILLMLAALCLFPQGGSFVQRHGRVFKPWTTPVPTTTTPSPAYDCSRELLLFEFFTKEPPADVKDVFENVNVLYSFKVYGAGQYLFIVENDQSQYLKDLALPDDAIQTASVVPLETRDTFLRRLGIDSYPENLVELSDENLTFFERTWPATGMNEDRYRETYRELIRQLSETPISPPPVIRFNPVANYPTKNIVIWNGGDCFSAERIFNFSDPFGGPGFMNVRMLKIYNI